LSLSSIRTISAEACKSLKGVFCDIDDTLTTEGRLDPPAFAALATAKEAGLRVIPVTGRPAGWADHIARFWPVDGVVAENGGLWFYMNGGSLQRRFHQPLAIRDKNRQALTALSEQILKQVSGTALASDQPYRELDLAIDFCEDVPALPEASIDAIVSQFENAGAICKVSSIHVNGWYGDFDKWTGCVQFIRDRYDERLEEDLERYVYFGDSANDEPMFQRFALSIGVANVVRFLPRMTHHPAFLCTQEGGLGFAEGIEHILNCRHSSR